MDDPIFSPFNKEVIRLYLDRVGNVEGIARATVIGYLAAKLMIARGTRDVVEVAEILGVEDPREIESSMNHVYYEAQGNTEILRTRSKQIWEKLLGVSNVVSAQVFNYYLRKHPKRRQIAVYLGKAHEEVVTMDLSQIPEALKLTDREIEELLKSRKEEELKRILGSYNIKDGSDEGKRKKGGSFRRGEAKGTKEGEVEMESKSKGSRSFKELVQVKAPEDIIDIIEKWSENLFGLEYVRRRGYEYYLKSDSSLYQIWGAAALLAEKVKRAKEEGRDLTSEELKEVREALYKAAEARKREGGIRLREGEEIEKLANNVRILAEIMKSLE